MRAAWLGVEHQLSAVGGRILLADAPRRLVDALRTAVSVPVPDLCLTGTRHMPLSARLLSFMVSYGLCGTQSLNNPTPSARSATRASSKLVTMEEHVARRAREHRSRGWGPANELEPLLGRRRPPASCLGRGVGDARLRRRRFNFLQCECTNYSCNEPNLVTY